MTKEEVEKLRGHWSTPELALKDAFRMILHARRGCTETGCSTCEYIDKRLLETGFTSHEGAKSKP